MEDGVQGQGSLLNSASQIPHPGLALRARLSLVIGAKTTKGHSFQVNLSLSPFCPLMLIIADPVERA